MKQLTLFDEWGDELSESTPPDSSLNGFCYERLSDRFVSFALGSRHFEISPKECDFPKEWQKRVMKDRAI
ncbi:hypothetical protein [Brevibacillus porteri]|uniref:hypothetical protein n=1 Tax=Brevibacillus porteri TaxID=2126350 RepID=UPI003D229B36